MSRLPLALAATSLLAFALPAQQAQPCLSASDNQTVLLGTSTGGPNLLIGIKLTNGPNTIPVLAAEVFTGLRVGPNTLGIWTHDAVNNRPGVDLGTGTWTNMMTTTWQGANLVQPVILQPNQEFWLVWGMQNGQQVTAEARNTTSGQPYRGSFDGGQNWNGPFVQYDWKYRLWCVPRGDFLVYGNSCPGSNRTTPRMGASGAPAIGQNFSLLLTGTLANTPCTAFLGVSDQSWGGVVPLPFHLAPFGASNCFVNADLMIGVPATTDAQGAASLTFPIANNPSYFGVALYAQWVVVDPAANALQLVTSEGGRMRFGN